MLYDAMENNPIGPANLSTSSLHCWPQGRQFFSALVATWEVYHR
jgi:hypothetical protein